VSTYRTWVQHLHRGDRMTDDVLVKPGADDLDLG
jgi:hypothetical protein